ncbi:MAG: hypothetical protein JWP85_595 [Rhodoglobus sp.]|nr:hypothetical protein [Rhodoglobus sp.]
MSEGDATAGDNSVQSSSAGPTLASSDEELVDLAELTLTAAGYSVKPTLLDNLTILVAQNRLNLLVVAATVSVEALLISEASLSRLISERLDADPSTRWDGYLILMTTQAAETRQSTALFGITYNLRQVRRIVRVGVEPTRSGVAQALRPVLPLSQTFFETATIDPLDLLAKRLVQDGLEVPLVDESISRFRTVRRISADGESVRYDEIAGGEIDE